MQVFWRSVYKHDVLFIGHRQNDETLRSVAIAYHLGLYCFLTEISSKYEIKKKKKILLIPLEIKVESPN